MADPNYQVGWLMLTQSLWAAADTSQNAEARRALGLLVTDAKFLSAQYGLELPAPAELSPADEARADALAEHLIATANDANRAVLAGAGVKPGN